MAPSLAAARTPKGVERVREQLLTALHLGRLRPGDRFLSVRRLADLTGLNRKTIHRAFQELVREGYLEIRPGSGTYVAEDPSAARSRHSDAALLSILERVRNDAAACGLDSATFASFLSTCLAGGLRDLPVAVVECNLEQIGAIAYDLVASIGVAPRAVMLQSLAANAAKAADGVAAVVTTDCHRAEVSEALRQTGVPVYRLSLDAQFPQRIVQAASEAPVVLVTADRAFEPVFMRLLGQLRAGAVALGRIRILDAAEARTALRLARPETRLWVSPMLENDPAFKVPSQFERIGGRWHVDAGGVDTVRARLALDLAVRRAGTA